MKFQKPVLLFLIITTCSSRIDLRQKVGDAFGGLEKLEQLQEVTFSITRYRYSQTDTINEKRFYKLNTSSEFFQEVSTNGVDTVVLKYENGKASKLENGTITQLDSAGTVRLYEQLYFNFLYLLPKTSAWKQMGTMPYRDKQVLIVAVQDSKKIAEEIHLLVDPETNQIISSSIPTNGQYEYFADEYDYQKIECLDIYFPMRYEVVVDGKVIQAGVFSDFCSR